MSAQAETYALARALFLQQAGNITFAAQATRGWTKAEAYADAATTCWDLAAAFVSEAQRRQPEAWAVLPTPTKEQP